MKQCASPAGGARQGVCKCTKIIEPEEVAKLVLYLASNDASAITGQTYILCGGQSMD